MLPFSYLENLVTQDGPQTPWTVLCTSDGCPTVNVPNVFGQDCGEQLLPRHPLGTPSESSFTSSIRVFALIHMHMNTWYACYLDDQ